MIDHNEFYNHEKIPETTKIALDLYIRRGVIPGRFLTEVLENNLKLAYKNADDHNLVAIPSIVYYLYNNAPANCWGSPHFVTEWVKQRGMEGLL